MERSSCKDRVPAGRTHVVRDDCLVYINNDSVLSCLPEDDSTTRGGAAGSIFNRYWGMPCGGPK